MIEFEEITTLQHKSCGMSIVDCLADADIASRKTAFNTLIETAITLGLMPDDGHVLDETLRKYGFIVQSTKLEGITVEDALLYLEIEGFPDVAFIHMSAPMHFGGYMLAFRADENRKPELVSELPTLDTDYLKSHTVHVWIHWDNGGNRSLFPRNSYTSKGEMPVSSPTISPETRWYKPYQPNPCQNYIGDCVIRGVAGAMNITWEEALRLLATSAKTTVNAREVYPVVLARQGFVHHEPIIRNGRHLDGKVFCDAMNWQYQKGERVFAHVGRCHVAAIIPIRCDDGVKRYKIADSWDSTSRTIGDYWVLPAELLPEKKNAPVHPSDLKVGSRILHKTYGKGKVVTIDGVLLTIDFGSNGVRRLEKSWVEKNCFADS